MLTITNYRYSDNSKQLLVEIASSLHPNSKVPMIELLETLKGALPLFKMLNLDFIPIDDSFTVKIMADSQRIEKEIKNELNYAKVGYGWLANIVHAFAKGVSHVSLHVDYFKGPLKPYLSLHLLDEYLRQADGYYADGRIDLFFKRKDLLNICLPANQIFKDALVLWAEMKSKSSRAYTPYDGKVKNYVHNNTKIVVVAQSVEKQAYLIAKEIYECVKENILQAAKNENEYTRGLLYDLLGELDNNPYAACVILNNILSAVFPWEPDWKKDVESLYNIRRSCRTLLPLGIALGSTISWCMKNVTDAVSSMIHRIMEGSCDYVLVSNDTLYPTLPEKYNKVFISSDLQYEEILLRDKIISAIGLVGINHSISQIARMFDVCYNYIIKMEKWADTTNTPYPIVDVGLNKNVEFFHHKNGKISFLEYRKQLDAMCPLVDTLN